MVLLASAAVIAALPVETGGDDRLGVFREGSKDVCRLSHGWWAASDIMA
jgi:hypothetical protein